MWTVGTAARQSRKSSCPFFGSRRCVSTFPRFDRQRRKEVCNFVLGGVRRVRAVDGIVVDRFCKIGADGSRRSLFGIGRAHQLPIQRNSVFALEHLDHDRGRAHEVDQTAEKGPFAMNRIKTLRFIAGQPCHPGGDDLESRALETSIDRSDDIFGDRVRLNDGKGAFYRHSRAPTELMRANSKLYHGRGGLSRGSRAGNEAWQACKTQSGSPRAFEEETPDRARSRMMLRSRQHALDKTDHIRPPRRGGEPGEQYS